MKTANLKYLFIFILGLTSVLFTYAYTTIETDLDNAVQYIQKVVLTDNTGNTGIVLGGEVDSYIIGKLGIGTSAPSSKLHVNGDVFVENGDVLIDGAVQSEEYCNESGGECKSINNVLTYNTNEHGSNFNVTMGNRFNIAVGLWDTYLANNTYWDYGAGETRMLKSGPSSMIQLGSEGEIKFLNAGSGAVDTHVGFNDRLVIDINGDVGIGTSAPSSKLDVDGTINATSYSVSGSGGITHTAQYKGTDSQCHQLEFQGGLLVGTGTC